MSRLDKILAQYEEDWGDDFLDFPREVLLPHLSDEIEREWNYFVRDNDTGDDNLFDFITKRIAVGRAPWRPNDCKRIAAAGITHVIDCRAESAISGKQDWAPFPNVSYLWAGFDDDFRHKPIELFDAPIRWAVDALQSNPKAKVFAHCAAGMNRGPSMAYGVLRAATGMRPDAALDALRKARPIAFAPYRGDVDTALQTFGLCR